MLNRFHLDLNETHRTYLGQFHFNKAAQILQLVDRAGFPEASGKYGEERELYPLLWERLGWFYSGDSHPVEGKQALHFA